MRRFRKTNFPNSLPELGDGLVEQLHQLQNVDVDVLNELEVGVVGGLLAVGDRELGQPPRDAAEDGVEVVDAEREEHLIIIIIINNNK